MKKLLICLLTIFVISVSFIFNKTEEVHGATHSHCICGEAGCSSHGVKTWTATST